MRFWPACILLFASLNVLVFPNALADSKILATSGATQFEGAAGGGIVPWALIGGYGDGGEWGGSLAATRVSVDDFQLDVAAAHLGIGNRWELSFSHQDLRVEPLGLNIRQDVIGAKVKLHGDVIYTNWPQISLGLHYKKNRDGFVPVLLGANDDSGTDIYLAASKLYLDAFLGRNLFVNATARWTEANQTGLLGFGSNGSSDYSLQGEASAGVFLNRHWVLGAEYRQKPDNLAAVKEDDWKDLFLAWFPNKHAAVVLAWSDLGDIAGLPDQSGWYLSFQLNH